MAITSINISQSNTTDTCNLVSVHNPLIFLVDVAYTSSAPDVLNIGLYDETPTLLETFVCIPYSDITGIRTFAFLANDIIKGYMGSIEDFFAPEKTIQYVDGMTKEFKLVFYDPSTPTTNDELTIIAMHAARQFSEAPYLESIQINEDETYFAGENMPVYVYVYNNSETNVITVGTGELVLDKLLDYDDIIFLDFDDLYLLAV